MNGRSLSIRRESHTQPRSCASQTGAHGILVDGNADRSGVVHRMEKRKGSEGTDNKMAATGTVKASRAVSSVPGRCTVTHSSGYRHRRSGKRSRRGWGRKSLWSRWSEGRNDSRHWTLRAKARFTRWGTPNVWRGSPGTRAGLTSLPGASNRRKRTRGNHAGFCVVGKDELRRTNSRIDTQPRLFHEKREGRTALLLGREYVGSAPKPCSRSDLRGPIGD
jgi:hypothetical protein